MGGSHSSSSSSAPIRESEGRSGGGVTTAGALGAGAEAGTRAPGATARTPGAIGGRAVVVTGDGARTGATAGRAAGAGLRVATGAFAAAGGVADLAITGEAVDAFAIVGLGGLTGAVGDGAEGEKTAVKYDL